MQLYYSCFCFWPTTFLQILNCTDKRSLEILSSLYFFYFIPFLPKDKSFPLVCGGHKHCYICVFYFLHNNLTHLVIIFHYFCYYFSLLFLFFVKMLTVFFPLLTFSLEKRNFLRKKCYSCKNIHLFCKM